MAAPLDYRIIAGIIHEGATVLDLGCGNGELLRLLVQEKNVRAQGIELDDRSVFACVGKGLSVFHDDIDSGLSDYGDKSFDFVILNQSFQQVRQPETVLKEALRVGARVIVGIPNFAHISSRCQIFFGGRTPVTPALPYEWYNTPNLHFLSILDFKEYCRKSDIPVEASFFIDGSRHVRFWPNLFARVGIFLLSNVAQRNHGR